MLDETACKNCGHEMHFHVILEEAEDEEARERILNGIDCSCEEGAHRYSLSSCPGFEKEGFSVPELETHTPARKPRGKNKIKN